MSKRLTQEGQDLADEFSACFGDRGCTCFISPPCSYCTHPGNPLCLEETPELWEEDQPEIDYLEINASFAKGSPS